LGSLKSTIVRVRIRAKRFLGNRSDALRTRILFTLALAASAAAVFGLSVTRDFGGLLLNLGSELAGAIVIYLVLDQRVGKREQLERLKREMGSRSHDTAIAAAEELSDRGWLSDGSLNRIDLWEASLDGARLGGARLEGANLMGARLKEAFLYQADLRWANLESADLREAVLDNARLGRAHLADATLSFAVLREADMRGCNLELARLDGALLEGAQLEGSAIASARFTTRTQLPDGTHWSTDTDVARFTDLSHPEFWAPPLPSR
jgi:hypothetical protein